MCLEPFYHSESTFETGSLWAPIVPKIWHLDVIRGFCCDVTLQLLLWPRGGICLILSLSQDVPPNFHFYFVRIQFPVLPCSCHYSYHRHLFKNFWRDFHSECTKAKWNFHTIQFAHYSYPLWYKQLETWFASSQILKSAWMGVFPRCATARWRDRVHICTTILHILFSKGIFWQSKAIISTTCAIRSDKCCLVTLVSSEKDEKWRKERSLVIK